MNDEPEWNRARLWKISEITWRWWMLYSLTRSLFFGFFFSRFFLSLVHLLLFSFRLFNAHMPIICLWFSLIFIPLPLAQQMLSAPLTCRLESLGKLSQSRCRWKIAGHQKLVIFFMMKSIRFLPRLMLCALLRWRAPQNRHKHTGKECTQKKLEENSTDLFHLKSIESLSQWWCLKLHVVHVVQILLSMKSFRQTI